MAHLQGDARMSDDLLQNATPQQGLEMLDLEIARAWMKLLKAKSNHDIDKQMARVDALLDQRLLLTTK